MQRRELDLDTGRAIKVWPSALLAAEALGLGEGLELVGGHGGAVWELRTTLAAATTEHDDKRSEAGRSRLRSFCSETVWRRVAAARVRTFPADAGAN